MGNRRQAALSTVNQFRLAFSPARGIIWIELPFGKGAKNVDKLSVYQGCLLGLAAGDAMGFSVDAKTYEEICADCGPGGLQGYDLINGYADISSHTQIAAFVCNSLLMGITRGQLQGHMGPYCGYIALGLKQWRLCQVSYRLPQTSQCWIAHDEELRRRHCMDSRMKDILSRERLGTPEEPISPSSTAGAVTCAIPVSLFYDPDRMQFQEIGRLAMESVALTHGSPIAFLSGAALAYALAGILHAPETSLAEQFLFAADAVAGQFGREYPQAIELRSLIRKAVMLAQKGNLPHPEIMEHLVCDNAAQVLAGAVYACVASLGDFDSALVIAVNHSGRSAAVGALTGALLGARLGVEALPEFYMESLACAPTLRELAEDLTKGCPMQLRSRLFDDDWDQKYIQGNPVPKSGWEEA